MPRAQGLFVAAALVACSHEPERVVVTRDPASFQSAVAKCEPFRVTAEAAASAIVGKLWRPELEPAAIYKGSPVWADPPPTTHLPPIPPVSCCRSTEPNCAWVVHLGDMTDAGVARFNVESICTVHAFSGAVSCTLTDAGARAIPWGEESDATAREFPE